jgi:hypothetical protein
MKLGSNDISAVKIGTNQVQAIYQGANLVWQNAPVATTATGVGQTSFTANWNAYTGAVVYLLDVSKTSDFSTFVYENQQVNAPSTSYVVIGLEPNTTYYYRVRASTEALTDPDYQAVLDYATTQGYTLPSSSQQTLQNQLVLDLKSAGIWSKLDTFAVFATDGDSDFALIDWIRVTDYTAVNSPTFTTNKGFESDGVSAYIDTNWNLSTDTVNYQQDDAGILIGVTDQSSIFQTQNRYTGTTGSNYNTGMRVDYNSLHPENRNWINTNSFFESAFDTKVNDTIYFANRTSSTSVNTRNTHLATPYTNSFSGSTTSSALLNVNQLILTGSSQYSYVGNRVGIVGFGSNFSSSEMDDIETAWYTNYFSNL